LAELIGPFDWQAGAGAQPLLVGTHLKLHPVCYHGQAGVDAAIRLRREVPVDRIAAVEVETYDAAFRVMGRDEERWSPANRETADHSLPYTVAIALQDGRLESASYADERLVEPATRALMKKISVKSSPAMTKAYPGMAQTRISIRDTDGRTHAFLQEYPRGHAANPVSDAELEEKFGALYPAWGDSASARKTMEALWTLDRCASVARLVDVFCPLA
jgi:2-methylcitrate dehydratase